MGYKLVAIVGVAAGLLLALFYDWDTFNPDSIRGKRILITGASSGIGEELAYQYSKLGASIVITARRNELLQKVATKCKALGAAKVEYVVADMGISKDRQKVVDDTEKHLGGLDHLILNHAQVKFGRWLGTPQNVTKLSEQLEINFISFVDITSRCLKMLTESKGNIGVVSSVCGKIPVFMASTYSTSKFALQGFYASLRQELRLSGTGISVTVCVLGYIATDAAVDTMRAQYGTENNFLTDPAPVNETAIAIIKSIDKRQYEMYYPSFAWYIVTVHKFIPHYLEDYLFFMQEKMSMG